MKRIPSTVLIFIMLSCFVLTCKVQRPAYFNKKIQFNLTGIIADSSADIIPLNSMKAIANGDKITIEAANRISGFDEVSMVVVKRPPPPPPPCHGCDDFRITYLGDNHFKVFNVKDNVSLTYRARSIPSKFLTTMNALINKEISLKQEMIQSK